MGLPNVDVKFKSLLYNRILTMGARDGSMTSELLRFCYVPEALTNPAYALRTPSKLVYLRRYLTDMTCVAPYAAGETRKQFKRRICNVLLRLAMIVNAPSELRIVRKFPDTN